MRESTFFFPWLWPPVPDFLSNKVFWILYSRALSEETRTKGQSVERGGHNERTRTLGLTQSRFLCDSDFLLLLSRPELGQRLYVIFLIYLFIYVLFASKFTPKFYKFTWQPVARFVEASLCFLHVSRDVEQDLCWSSSKLSEQPPQPFWVFICSSGACNAGESNTSSIWKALWIVVALFFFYHVVGIVWLVAGTFYISVSLQTEYFSFIHPVASASSEITSKCHTKATNHNREPATQAVPFYFYSFLLLLYEYGLMHSALFRLCSEQVLNKTFFCCSTSVFFWYVLTDIQNNMSRTNHNYH